MVLDILVYIASGNSLAPVRCQAITWNNANLLNIWPIETKYSEIWVKNLIFFYLLQ